jgi:dUTP pyrophosphatase
MASIEPVRVEVDVVETNHRVPVKVVLTHPDAQMPFYAKDGDAGADIRAVNSDSIREEPFAPVGDYYDEKLNRVEVVYPGDYIIHPGETAMLKTGIRIELQPGWEMQVRSRSGMAARGLVVANSPGTIDSGYRGPCSVLLYNSSRFTRVVKPHTRVAQFVLKRAPQADFQLMNELSDSERGEGGFGSTGTQ